MKWSGTSATGSIIDLPELRDRVQVFRNRAHAGEILAGMLESYQSAEAIVLAIPAGGVPVAAACAGRLNLPFDVVVVSKITLPWDSEAGYGAVAFDGTVCLNYDLVRGLGLTEQEIQQGIGKTLRKVSKRVSRLRGGRVFPALFRRLAIVIDDGLASGFTMHAAVEALKEAGAGRIIVAVPTGHAYAARKIAREVEAVYCANIRSGSMFAVADAYEQWSDVDEEELGRLVKSALAKHKTEKQTPEAKRYE